MATQQSYVKAQHAEHYENLFNETIVENRNHQHPEQKHNNSGRMSADVLRSS